MYTAKETTYKSVWFTEWGTVKPIGIIIVCDPAPREAYIGTGDGMSQKDDEIKIARHGAKFPLNIAINLIF